MTDIDLKLRLPQCWDFLPGDKDQLRKDLHELLLVRTSHLGIDESAPRRLGIERHFMAMCDSPDFDKVYGILLFNEKPGGKHLPVSAVVCAADLDLSDPRTLDGLAELEAPGALVAEVVSLRDGLAVVSVREDQHREDTTELKTPMGAEYLAALAAYYEVDAPDQVPDVTEYVRRDISVWLPIPNTTRSLLFQFVVPVNLFTDTLTELCLETVSTVVFRERPS